MCRAETNMPSDQNTAEAQPHGREQVGLPVPYSWFRLALSSRDYYFANVAAVFCSAIRVVSTGLGSALSGSLPSVRSAHSNARYGCRVGYKVLTDCNAMSLPGLLARCLYQGTRLLLHGTLEARLRVMTSLLPTQVSCTLVQ